MNRFGSLARSAYAVALMLVAVPVAEAAVSVWPVRIHAVAWRFGAAGVFSRSLLTPVLGVLLALFAAVALEHRRVQRVLAVGSGGVAVFLGGALLLLALDAVQMWAQVNPSMRPSFTVAALVALAKYLLAMTALAAFAADGWRPAPERGRAPEPPHRAPRGAARWSVVPDTRAAPTAD